MAKPVIGITCDVVHADRNHRAHVYLDYINSVERAGGVPVLLVATGKPELVIEQLNRVDAVLGIGGNDYCPSLFGQDRHAYTQLLSERRQDFDMLFFSEIWRRRIPALLICASCQGINIAQGGDLIQHLEGIEQTHAHEHGFSLAHDLSVEPDTLLHQVLDTLETKVNSFHHQAVDQPGTGLRVSARAADGTIEALEPEEFEEHPLLAVQWHPERIPNEPESKLLFNWLVHQAALDRPYISAGQNLNRLSPFF